MDNPLVFLIVVILLLGAAELGLYLVAVIGAEIARRKKHTTFGKEFFGHESHLWKGHPGWHIDDWDE